MKSWANSDRKLITLTVLLLAMEVVWMLMHLNLVPNPFSKHQTQWNQKAAGTVLHVQRDLKKRNMNSLLWETAAPEDTLYYYDSVLTLPQSSATLFLEQKTEVHLSENTLVTIEPLEQNADNQIRLKFTRGDLRTSNPYASTKIETKEWSLELNQGSEVSLRQMGDKDFEVEVHKGQLEFQKDSQSQTLGENQVLQIEDNQVSGTLAVDSALQFQGPKYQRLYSSNPLAAIPIAWKGQADKLEITPVGSDSSLQALSSQQSQSNLQLPPGKYSLRLKNGSKVSEAKEIEIWEAPMFHLLAPFPRDRVKTEEPISFVWSFIPEAKEYELILTNPTTGEVHRQKVKDNFSSYEFPNEGDFEWKVIALDPDGFPIASPYTNMIFPRHQPLAAPVLKSPEIRIPASQKKKRKGSFFSPPSWLRWVLTWALPEAMAEKKSAGNYEAVFAWEPVDGADQYTIEIAANPDFRKTAVSKVTKRTEFIWSGFSLGIYYWRVAAGSSKGRMGVFSEPAKVNLQSLPDNESSTDGVLIRKRTNPDKDRAKVETKTESIIANAPRPQFDESIFEKETKLISDEQRELKDTYLIEWTPIWSQWNLADENDLKVKLSGNTTGAAHFQTEQALSGDKQNPKSYFVDIFYAQYKWKATDISTYPFQEDQNQTDARVQILFGNSKSSVRRGGIVQTVPIPERKNLEQIELSNALTIGPSVYYNWKDSERWKSGHSLSFLAGNSLFVLSTQNNFRYLFFKGESNNLSIGFRFQADGIFYQRAFNTGWGASLTLGWQGL